MSTRRVSSLDDDGETRVLFMNNNNNTPSEPELGFVFGKPTLLLAKSQINGNILLGRWLPRSNEVHTYIMHTSANRDVKATEKVH